MKVKKNYVIEWLKFFSFSTGLCLVAGGAVNYAAAFLMESFVVSEETSLIVQCIIWALAYSLSSFISFRLLLSKNESGSSSPEIKIDLEAETQAYE